MGRTDIKMNSLSFNVPKPLAIVVAVFLLQGCNLTTTTYNFAYKAEGSNSQIMEAMKEILEGEFYNVEIHLMEVEQPFEELDRVGSGEIDFLLHENYSPFDMDGITSAFLAYPKFLHVFHRKSDVNPGSFGDLINGKKIYLEHPNSAERLILQNLASYYSIPDDAYELTRDMSECDILLDLSSFLSEEFMSRLTDFELYSFGDVMNYGQGSHVEGISLKLHRLRPYVIPEGTYGELTSSPKLTLELDMVMLASEQIGNVAVYDLISTVLRHKQSFVSIDPILFIGLDEQFDRSRLSYPLHEGARSYLDREQPGFFERYAEVAGVSFSILIALITGLISFSKSRVQRKKDRVDVFYKELMDIKNEKVNTTELINQRIEDIKVSQNKAFDMLINEELSANESFRIYMELSKETISELRLRRKALRLKASKAAQS